MKRWATPEQHAWLLESFESFEQAQKDANVQAWLSLLIHDWLIAFPGALPESVSDNELESVNGDLDKAKRDKKKGVSLISSSRMKLSYCVLQQLRETMYNFGREKKGPRPTTKSVNLLKTKRPGHLLPYQAYQHLHYPSKLKKDYESGYTEYEREYEEGPRPRLKKKAAFAWGNERAALDLENETDEVKAEVKDYLLKYSTGEVKDAEEYRALIDNDQAVLESKRIERLRKVQK